MPGNNIIVNFDLTVFKWIYGLAGKSRLLDFFGIFLSEYFGYLLILIAIYLIFDFKDWKRRIHYSSFLLMSIIVSRGLITPIVRLFYYHPRPSLVLNIVPLVEKINAGEAAFPSGHMAFYFPIVLLIFYLNRKWGWYSAVIAGMVGIARVFVGVHWPLDIITGIVAGISGFYIAKALLLRYRPK